MKYFDNKLVSRYPLLYASQLTPSMTVMVVVLLLEAFIGNMLPISANPTLILAATVVSFLLIIFYRTFNQNNYFDRIFTFKEVYLLYLLNTGIVILLSTIIFALPYFLQHKVRAVLRVNNLEQDLTIYRISKLNYDEVKTLKTLLLFPQAKSAIIEAEVSSSSNMPLLSNEYVFEEIWHDYGRNSLANKKLFSFKHFPFVDTLPVRGTDVYLLRDSADKTSPAYFDLTKFDSTIYNAEGLRIISAATESSHTNLERKGIEISRKYDLPLNRGFKETNESIGRIFNNGNAIKIFFDPDYMGFDSFVLFVILYIPIIAISSALGKRYYIQFRNIQLPLVYLSFTFHICIMSILFFMVLFSTLGLYAVLIYILILIVLYWYVRWRQVNFTVQFFVTQLFHYGMLWPIPILSFLLFEELTADFYIRLHMMNFCFALFISWYFFRQYYKFQFQPLKS